MLPLSPPLGGVLAEDGGVLDEEGLLGVVFGLPLEPLVPLPELRRAFVSMNPLSERELFPVARLELLDEVDPAEPVSAPMPPCFKHPVTVTVSSREPRL